MKKARTSRHVHSTVYMHLVQYGINLEMVGVERGAVCSSQDSCTMSCEHARPE